MYEYDQSYKDMNNIVLEECKMECMLKHKHTCNIKSVKEWSKEVKTTKEKDHHINTKRKCNVSHNLQTQFKWTNAHPTSTNFTKATLKETNKQMLDGRIPQRQTHTEYGIIR